MHIPFELRGVLSIDPEVMGNDICFTGTRIPGAMLLDDVAAGVSMEDFHDAYPDLTPEQCEPVMEWENQQARKALGLRPIR